MRTKCTSKIKNEPTLKQKTNIKQKGAKTKTTAIPKPKQYQVKNANKTKQETRNQKTGKWGSGELVNWGTGKLEKHKQS